MKQVEFYFDLGSPYSYLGFFQIQKIAQQHRVLLMHGNKDDTQKAGRRQKY